MAYGKRSPLPKLKNTNAIDDVKSALQKKDIKITGAMGSELRAKQYKEKGWAMDNTIGSAQGGTYKKPTVPTGKFGSDLRRKEYEANNWAGDATTKDNMPGSKSTNTNTGGGKNTGGGTTTGGGTNTGGGNYSSEMFKNVMESAQQTASNAVSSFGNKTTVESLGKTAAERLAARAGSTYKVGGGKNTGGSNTNMLNATKNNNTNTVNTADHQANLHATISTGTGAGTSVKTETPKKPKYSLEGRDGKQRRRAKQANKYNTLARQAFDSGDTQESNRLIRIEADFSRKIKNTDERREKRRKRKLEKAQSKVKKYTK